MHPPGIRSSPFLGPSSWRRLPRLIWNAELAFLRHLYTMAMTWGRRPRTPSKRSASPAKTMDVCVC